MIRNQISGKNSKIGINHQQCVHISDACIDTGTMLYDNKGLISMNVPLYQDNVYCQWQINLEIGKVSIAYYLPAISFNTKQLEK